MRAAEAGLLAVGALITIIWIVGVRASIRRGEGTMQQTVNITMMFAVSVLVVFVGEFSPLHLLWMFPLSFIMGALSLLFPLSLISVPGRLFGRVCCFGLDRGQGQKKSRRLGHFQTLRMLGVDPEMSYELVKGMEEVDDLQEDELPDANFLRKTSVLIVHNERLDEHNSSDLKKEIVSRIDNGKTNIIIDLGEVKFINESGLACLYSVFKTAIKAEGDVKLSSLQPPIKEYLKLCGASKFFKIFPSLLEAVRCKDMRAGIITHKTS